MRTLFCLVTSLLLALPLLSCKQQSDENNKGDAPRAASPAASSGLPNAPAACAPNATTCSLSSTAPSAYEEWNGDGTFERIRVTFAGSRGDQVPAYMYRPKIEPGKRRPVVLVQYGIDSSKESNHVRLVAQALAKKGIISFTIDVPGRGERVSATGKIDNIALVTNRDMFLWYVNDYRKAIDYLAQHADVDATRIAYFGASWGAITGVPYVAGDSRIRSFVSVVGGGGFFGVISPELDPAQNIGKISPRPVMLINATRDQVIIKAFADALHNNAGANAEKIWLDADHTLSGVNLEELLTKAVQFVVNSIR